MNSGDSLRAELERRYAVGAYFTLKEAVAAMVPLITALGEMHQGGAKLYVHPSSIRFRPDACRIDIESAQQAPLLPRDRACLAPEERQGKPGDARASVFACGAILYEMVTGAAIGPGMRRPREIAPNLPDMFEMLITKALVSDPAHRPADLAALAQALYHCAPTASLPPPPADETALDHGADFDVDVSISMLPPPNVEAARAVVEAHIARAKAGSARLAAAPDGAASVVATEQAVAQQAVAKVAEHPIAASDAAPTSAPASGRSSAAASTPMSSGRTATNRLAELKQRLESDPRPRYIVIKEGMDHGPFTAVELLHQIATGNFVGEHHLRDAFSKDERPISDWEEFAPFADQARLSMDAHKERKQLEASVTKEKEQTHVKAFAIASVALLGLAAIGGIYFKSGKRETKTDGVRMGQAQNVDFEGGVGKGKAAKQPGGKWAGGAARGPGEAEPSDNGNSNVTRPVLPGGMSCEAASSKYIEDYSKDAPPDLTHGAYGGVLNRGDYLNACGVPPSMAVNICAAVQNGQAVGVTVSTNPPNGGIARCIAGQVRSLSFPSHPRLDVTHTVFAAQ
jgi:hypothetical protein